MIIGTNSNPIVSGKYYIRLWNKQWWKPQQVLQKPYDDNDEGT